MKRCLTMTFAVVATAATAFGADNTLGSWKYNTARSTTPAGVSPITRLTVTREAISGGVKVTAKGERKDGSKIDTTTIAKYDGKEVPVKGSGLAWDTVSIKQSGDNALIEERTRKGGKYHSTVKTVVSGDGKTMTATFEGTGTDGRPLTGTSVFDKQ